MITDWFLVRRRSSSSMRRMQGLSSSLPIFFPSENRSFSKWRAFFQLTLCPLNASYITCANKCVTRQQCMPSCKHRTSNINTCLPYKYSLVMPTLDHLSPQKSRVLYFPHQLQFLDSSLLLVHSLSAVTQILQKE